MATIHNEARCGEIAETILLPGDPLRAQYIAEHYLENARLFNKTRNMYGYTGSYKGKEISVMGTGMGCPSMGIYTHELIHEYGVKNLIRIGSCGGISERVKMGDLVLSMGSSTNSAYIEGFEFEGTYCATASYELLEKCVQTVRGLGYSYVVGNTFCCDTFYRKNKVRESWKEMGILGTEMEAYALYCNAAKGGVNALAMFTVADNLLTEEHMDAQQREKGLHEMILAALETALKC